MSSTAPWRAALHAQLSAAGIPAFTLSTIASTPAGPAPRARTVVFRGFLADLPPNPHNPAPRNPPLWTSDVLTITTDQRMAKADELGGDHNNGGLFEAVFWAPGWTSQWRVRGRGYLLGPQGPASSDVRAVLEACLRRRRRRQPTDGQSAADGHADDGHADDDLAGWSWAREVTAHFGNLTADMRGSFRNPAPGVPVREGAGGDGLGLGQTVDDVQDGVAREHFRVVALVPAEVDYVSLEDPKRAQRWMYRLDEATGGWTQEEVWP